MRERPQTRREEVANSLSHGIALVAALAGAPFLLLEARRHGTAAIVGASVFSASVVFLYLSSAIYHALPWNRAKRVFRVLDHAAICLLIAGTYTPFTIGVLSGAWGWSLLGAVWTLAILGIANATMGGTRRTLLSTGLYLGMGWLIVIAIQPLWARMPLPGLLWLAAGGLAYTAGAGFFLADRVRYAHFVFHLLVVAGTACHFVAVWRYAA